jgi:hypothetical protein
MVSLKFNNIMIFLIVVGLLFISFGLGQYSVNCPKQSVLYKYLPRNFIQDSIYSEYLSDDIKDMFTKSDPYIVTIGNDNLKKSKW